ncbi:hypothetical protein HGRIS_001391 [Hohenbuehelia grisea]|uniref:Uncharacterized protein n=1 Tax=Hohenbuehelia grisea TaxID=104357 RepID=A0ABR3JQ79_9AGAR
MEPIRVHDYPAAAENLRFFVRRPIDQRQRAIVVRVQRIQVVGKTVENEGQDIRRTSAEQRAQDAIDSGDDNFDLNRSIGGSSAMRL